MAQPQPSDGVIYLCVADVLVTEQGKTRSSRIYKMRSVAHVLQKNLNIEEADPHRARQIRRQHHRRVLSHSPDS